MSNRITPSKAPSYGDLKLQNELLKAQAVVNEKAMGDMSKEICGLNNEILSLITQVQEMQ